MNRVQAKLCRPKVSTAMCAGAHLSSQCGGGGGKKLRHVRPAWLLEALSQNQTKRFQPTQSLSLPFIGIHTLSPPEAPKSLRRAFAHMGCICGTCLLLTHRCKPWAHPLGCSSDMPGSSHVLTEHRRYQKRTGPAAGQPHCLGHASHGSKVSSQDMACPARRPVS